MQALCSCTGVEVTNDLQVVKVFVSVYTEDQDIRKNILVRLTGLAGYVRRLIGERVRLRLTPEVRFVNDESFARGERILSLLKQVEEEGSEGAASPAQTQAQPKGQSGNGEQEEDEEEGFYVLGDEDEGEQEAADVVVQASPKAKDKPNPFLEGVGDDEYDDQPDEGAGFFTAEMFPDAQPELERVAARGKEAAWRQGQGRGRGGKAKLVRKP